MGCLTIVVVVLDLAHYDLKLPTPFLFVDLLFAYNLESTNANSSENKEPEFTKFKTLGSLSGASEGLNRGNTGNVNIDGGPQPDGLSFARKASIYQLLTLLSS